MNSKTKLAELPNLALTELQKGDMLVYLPIQKIHKKSNEANTEIVL